MGEWELTHLDISYVCGQITTHKRGLSPDDGFILGYSDSGRWSRRRSVLQSAAFEDGVKLVEDEEAASISPNGTQQRQSISF